MGAILRTALSSSSVFPLEGAAEVVLFLVEDIGLDGGYVGATQADYAIAPLPAERGIGHEDMRETGALGTKTGR